MLSQRRGGMFAAALFCFMAVQAPMAGAAGEEMSGHRLESVTVTAQKREENVQKVTSSITVLSDVAIEDSQIQTTRDIQGYVPNMRTLHSGSRDYFSRISIRGISNTGIGDPAVALYLDDVSYADVYLFDMPIYDVERVEVLKGPQGTLYGKNTEGGAINILTKEPSNNVEAKVRLEAGDYNKRYIDGLINAPVVDDKVFVRLSALKSSRDGYVENVVTHGDVDNQDTLAGRASVILKPTGNLDLNLTLGLSRYDDDGGFPMVPKDKEKYKAGTGITSLDDFQVGYDYIGKSKAESRNTSLRVKYEQDLFDLVSVTGYRGNEGDSTLDGDFTPADLAIGFNKHDADAWTQEMRLMSKPENTRLKWLLGLYYADEAVDVETGYRMGKGYAAFYGVPIGTEDLMSADLEARDSAVFGQSTLRFLDESVGVTAGLRYERAKRTMDRTHTFGGIETAPAMSGLEKTYSELLPKFAMDYRPTDDVMTYASVSRGYKAGGFSYAADNPDLAAFDPETSLAYEVGVKSDFPGIGLRTNIAAFYTCVDDYQDRVMLDPTNVLQSNAAEVAIYGAELETHFAVTDYLSLNAVFGYTHATYEDYIDPVTKESYSDNHVSLIPEYDLGVFLQYRNPWGLMARVEMQRTGESYLDRSNSVKQEPYTLYNVKMGYERETWDLSLAVRNLTDEQYLLDVFEDPTIGYMGTVGDPRTVSVSFNYRF